MLSLISNQTRNHLVYALFMLLGLVFASNITHAQSDNSRLVGSKEGTLIVNYWSSAPDPEVEQLRSVMVEALEMYLNGAVNIQEGEVNWRSNLRTIKKDMERLVQDLMVLRKFKEKVPFEGFSDEIDALLNDVDELDERDVARMHGSSNIPYEDRFYFLIQSRLQEVILQAGLELGWYVNKGLLALVGQTFEPVPAQSLEDWQNFDPNAPLNPLEVDFSIETMALIEDDDNSSLPKATPSTTESDLLQRIIVLLEDHNRRLGNLEQNQSNSNVPVNTLDIARIGLNNDDRPSPSSDPSLQALNLPDKFDVRFYTGSSNLTLNAQLQINELVGLMVRYPQLRLMCTGHADLSGDRVVNLNLSRARATTVRNYILDSGVNSERVVMNFFGEERAETRGAKDRRVIVTFFVEP
ncbi:MAG: OmpA family protein [Bacteroidetes bacterium]|jgi:outer membrane protein OmpA-like peptidoglycan-associated protein|nr:OmpA family protein [Bacteroidota bacterium]